MKRLFTLLGIAAAASAAVCAQTPMADTGMQEGIFTSVDENGKLVHKVVVNDQPVASTIEGNMNVAPRMALENITIKIKANLPSDATFKGSALSYAYRRKDEAQGLYRYSAKWTSADSTWTYTCPPGTYDILSAMQKGDIFYFICSENLVIAKDTTFTVDPADTKYEVNNEFVKPDGTPLKFPAYKTGEGRVYGNVDNSMGAKMLRYPGHQSLAHYHGITCGTTINADGSMRETWAASSPYFINDTKMFKPAYCMNSVDAKEGTYLIFIESDEVGNVTFKNDPADYLPTINFEVPRYNLGTDYTDAQKCKHPSSVYFLRNTAYSQGVGFNASNTYYKDDNGFYSVATYMCIPKKRGTEHSYWQYMFTPTKVYAEKNGRWGIYQPTIMQPNLDRELVMTPRMPKSIINDGLIDTYGNNSTAGTEVYKNNTFFSFNPYDYKGVDIVNTPTVNMVAYRAEKFALFPIGLYGTIRTIDKVHNANVEISFNDSIVCTNFVDLNAVFTRLANLPSKLGDWKIKFDTQNFEVDGINGYNKTEMNFNTATEEFAPSMRLMQFRDKADKINNRAKAASDLTLYFAANTYTFSSSPQYLKMAEPTNILVEYAPNGTTEFKALNVTPRPELYYAPNIGNVYSVDLRQADAESKNGWYDMRFTLDDGKGHKQVQTVGPAFYVGEGTGVKNINDERPCVFVQGNNIIAPSDAVITNLAGIQTGSCNLAPGVYIVRTAGTSVKVTVK